MKTRGIHRPLKAALALLVAGCVLAACSAGGGKTASTGTTTTTTASDLVVTLDKTSVASSGAETATVTVTAVDANRNAVSGATVSIVPDANAVITPSGTTTNTSGIVTGTLSIGSDHSNRTIDVVIKSGSITKTTTVSVTGSTLQATPSSASPGSTATIQYHLVDSTSANITNTAIEVAATGFTTVDGVTDANGKFVYTYTVPTTGNAVVFTATAAGASASSSVTISAGSIPAASGTPVGASVAANPSNVAVNAAGSTTNQSDIRALFLGAGNLPIQNVRVRFDLDGDVNNIGGTLSSGTGYVYSDADGIARTTYVPGTVGSGNQVLTIRACWSVSDFAAGTCPNATPVTTTLTVTSSGVSVAIFTNAIITVDDAKTSYQVPFSVQVVDSAGQPQSGVLVTGSTYLPRFRRGYWNGTTQIVANTCPNEDINQNNVLDTYNGQTEDVNDSGVLDPAKAIVAIIPTSTGSDTTDSFGKAYFIAQYGENYGSWVDYVVTFTATVQGTEGRASIVGTLPVPASALTSTSGSPPFQFSPLNYTAQPGMIPSTVGTTTVTDPVTGNSAALCQAEP